MVPSNETMATLQFLHPLAKVDFPPFINDFHLKTKVTSHQEAFIFSLTCSPHLISSSFLNIDVPPSSLCDPKRVQRVGFAELVRNLVPLPASNTKRGRGVVLEAPGLDQEEIKLFGHEPASKTNMSWLEVIMHAFGVGTSHGLTRTHMTHHGPDSGEATTFPLIVFFTAPRRGYIQMAFFPETPKVESRNCPGLDSQDFGHPPWEPRAWIRTRFEPKLQFSSRAFQRHIALPLQTSRRGRFPTFSGRTPNPFFPYLGLQMSKWPMRGQFKHLHFKTFPMTSRTLQYEVFWPFNSSSEFSGVPEDSKFPLLGVWASPSHLAQSGVATNMVYKHL